MKQTLLRRNAIFIEAKCPKCGGFILLNLWGQKWCYDSKCDYRIIDITTKHPLPEENEEVVKPKPVKPKAVRKKKGEK